MKIIMDEYCYLDCYVENGNPIIKVKGDYTTTNEHSLGYTITYINCGRMNKVELDLSSPIEIEYIQRFEISETECAIGFYTTKDLVLIYFNLETGEIGHQISPREDIK